MTNGMKTFSHFRKTVGTQEQVAQILGVSNTSISMWEKGNAYPRRNTLRAIAKLFNVEEGEILTSIDNSKKTYKK